MALQSAGCSQGEPGLVPGTQLSTPVIPEYPLASGPHGSQMYTDTQTEFKT